MISTLEDESNTWDFNRNDVLEGDRSEAEWIKTDAELQQLWRKQLKSSLLSLKLADKNHRRSTGSSAATLTRTRNSAPTRPKVTMYLKVSSMP